MLSRLTALVPGPVCAAALGRDWPDDLDGQVRCIDEGTRSLGLPYCCAPWSVESEDAALRAELGDHTDPGAGSPGAPMGDLAAGAHPNLKSIPSHRCKSGTDLGGDSVAAGLARVPGALPVLGLVSGPLTWGMRIRSGPALEDAVDAASDLAAGRVRALAGYGAERVVVVESMDAGDSVAAELLVEAHRPILRSAHHLRTDVLLAMTVAGAAPPSSLGYDCWASGRGCSPGLGFLPADAFDSAAALERWLDRTRGAGGLEEIITAPLAGSVSPGLVRQAARALAQVVARP